MLEQIGFADAIPSGIEAMTRVGAVLRLQRTPDFPTRAGRGHHRHGGAQVPLHGQDPKFDMEPWGKKVYFGTAGAAVHIVDPITGEYRESTTKDLYDIARIVDEMEHIHFFQRAVVCRDLARSARDGFQHLLCQRDGH